MAYKTKKYKDNAITEHKSAGVVVSLHKKPVLPDPLPIFIDPRVKIALEEGLTERCGVEKAEDLFCWEKCLGCMALLEDNYCSDHENPCVKCDCLVKKLIAKINRKTHQHGHQEGSQ